MFDYDEAGLKAIAEYKNSPLTDYFNVKLARDLPEMAEFIASGFKDYSEFHEHKFNGGE
jgi:hypothetical protein